jgi:hypothetical protein
MAPIYWRPIRASVATVSLKLVRTRISIGWLILLVSVQRGDSPNILQFLLFSAVVFLPLHIDTNCNDLGVMLILCNGQCPQRFSVYYIRAYCTVTEGARGIFRMLFSGRAWRSQTIWLLWHFVRNNEGCKSSHELDELGDCVYVISWMHQS